MIGARWRPPLRIAWRTARRYPGRTVLIGTLSGLPIFGAAFLDTLVRTDGLPAAAKATREYGAADGRLEVTPYGRIIQVPGGGTSTPNGTPQRDPASVDVGALLPAGTRLVPLVGGRTVRLTAGDRAVQAQGEQLPLGDPLVAGITRLRSGRLPQSAGEVALAPPLAERLGVRPGDDVQVGDVRSGRRVRVVGLAGDPDCHSCRVAVGLPGWTGARPDGDRSYLLDLPGTQVADPAMAQRLAEHGISLESRDQVLHPDRWPTAGYSDTANAVALALLVAGFGLLEVVLLAGTAFAVAARRQVREIGLVLANGGRPADARRLVLGYGGVLGLVGAVAATALGIGAVFAGGPLWERLTNKDFAGLVLAPVDLAALVAVGLLSSLAAAYLPARGAGRVPVMAALAGRYGPPAGKRNRSARRGLIALGVGLVGAAVAARLWRSAMVPHPIGDQYVEPPSSIPYVGTMLLFFAVALIGLAVCTPALIGLTGRLAGRLPVTARLAVRDAARQRHRTGPAVAAVLVVVTGTVAFGFVVASYDRHDRAQYQPRVPLGSATLYRSTDTPPAELLAAARTAAAALPGATVVHVQNAVRAGKDGYPAGVESPDDATCWSRSTGSVGIGSDLAAAVAGAQAAQARTALAEGKALVFAPCLIPDGRLTLLIGDTDRRTVPAVALPDAVQFALLPAAVLPAQLAGRLGLVPQSYEALILTSRMPTSAEEDRAQAAVGDVGLSLDVEHGYGSPYRAGFLALTAAAGVITLAGVAISVSLSAAESRADLATLAAVGAPPRRRRGLAASQAGLIAGLGALLGIAMGAVLGSLSRMGMAGYPPAVPWSMLLLVGLAVPALGVAVAALSTRSRLPMVRRLG